MPDEEDKFRHEWLDNMYEMQYDLDRGYRDVMDAEDEAIVKLHTAAHERLYVMERLALQAAKLTRARHGWKE